MGLELIGKDVMLAQHHSLCIAHAPIELLLKLFHVAFLRRIFDNLQFILIGVGLLYVLRLLHLEHIAAILYWRSVGHEVVESDVFNRILIVAVGVWLLAAQEPLRRCQTLAAICGLDCAQKLRVAIWANQCPRRSRVCVVRRCLKVGKNFIYLPALVGWKGLGPSHLI